MSVITTIWDGHVASSSSRAGLRAGRVEAGGQLAPPHGNKKDMVDKAPDGTLRMTPRKPYVTPELVDKGLATLYRRMPRLADISLGGASDEARQERCDRDHGHVLLVLDRGQIVCTRCPATWRDESG